MIKKRKLVVFFVIFFVLFIFTIQYFMSILSKSESEVRNYVDEGYEQKILQHLHNLPTFYRLRPQYYDNDTQIFKKQLQSQIRFKNISSLWNSTNASISKTNLFHLNDTNLGDVIQALKTGVIIRADLDTRGTQLKFLLTLEGNQTAVFKPKWYEKEKIIEGPVYAGKDRYGSEIVAFYLSGILNKPLVPISVKRRLNVRKEIISVASKQLLKTSFEHKNSTCIYGVCYYCKREDPICDVNGYITGAVIFNLGATIKSYRSPWQRTYKKNKRAVWETQHDYCRTVVGKVSKQRLFDLIDTAIFDFLIQNGDRHHYETLNERVVWIDNGKGLGNPNTHHIDILAPLYQCCILRSDTWNRLQYLSGGLLSEQLKQMPDVANFVMESHFKAMDERLLIIFATVEFCRSRNKIKHNLFYIILC